MLKFQHVKIMTYFKNFTEIANILNLEKKHKCLHGKTTISIVLDNKGET